MVSRTVELTGGQIDLLNNLLGWALDQAHDERQAGQEFFLEETLETTKTEVLDLLELFGNRHVEVND